MNRKIYIYQVTDFHMIDNICYPKISSKVLKGGMDKEISSKVQIEEDFRIILAKRKDTKEEG